MLAIISVIPLPFAHSLRWAVGLPEIPLHLVALTDAALHDSRSLIPHLRRVQIRFPDVLGTLRVVLDDDAIRRAVEEEFNAKPVVKPNPRGGRDIVEDLPKGIHHIEPMGTPVCGSGYPCDFLGVRKQAAHFLFSAPDNAEGIPVCVGCPTRDAGRVYPQRR